MIKIFLLGILPVKSDMISPSSWVGMSEKRIS